MSGADRSAPRLPEVGEFVRGEGTLIAVEVVPPPPQPPPKTDYIFEQITARTEFRLQGKTLREGETWTDFYGLGTSVNSAIESAKKLAAHFNLGPESNTEVAAVKIVSYYRARPNREEGFYAREFVGFERIKRGAESGVPEETETVVWSSAWPASKEES